MTDAKLAVPRRIVHWCSRNEIQFECPDVKFRFGFDTSEPTFQSQNALRFRKTSKSVLINIWMSSQRLQLLMYQRSISTRRAI